MEFSYNDKRLDRAIRPRGAYSEDLSCGYVALDETALVDGVGGCLQRLGVGRGPGEEAGEAKGGEDERQEKEGNEECETQA
jgi:hypothetical protein